jgi:hypothetical protein
MNKYNNSIIYIIKCKNKDIEDTYIGSTIDFKNRKRQHHEICYNENSEKFNYKLYKCIRENGGWDNFEMKEMIQTNCKDKYELLKLEGYYIKLYEPSLNKQIAGRTMEEWRNDNKEEIKEYKKEYNEKNKEYFKEYKKEWREKNKDKIKEYKKQYYEKHRDEVLKQQKEKIKCECGSFIRKSDIARHKQSKKHINLLK